MKETILKIIADYSGTEHSKLTDDKPYSELNMDSLDDVELIMELEEEFDLEISDEECEALGGQKTIGEIVEALVKKVDNQN